MPSRNPKRKDAILTRNALLAAAANTFARHGFKESNVRTICKKAGVNPGAITHYFGNKEALYREVLVLAHRELFDREPMPEISTQNPQAAMRQFVQYILRFLLLRRTPHTYAGQLIAWEIRNPTDALNELVAQFLMPVRKSLERIISALLGNADAPKLRGQCANFVFGLCIFHEQCQEMLLRVGYPIPQTESELEPLADAVSNFALGGIERLKHSISTST